MTATPKPAPATISTAWRVGTVRQVRVEAPGVRTFTFQFDEPVSHLSGQHYEIRLTAEDGYQAARLYSAASPAMGDTYMLQLTVALMPYGEVSPYLFQHATIDTQLEIRGPLGHYFTWSADQPEPVLLCGGGVGVAPLRAIRRDHMMSGSSAPLALLYSAGSYADVIYKYELIPKLDQPPSDVTLTFSCEAPREWTGHRGRIDDALIDHVLRRFETTPTCYVCGPTPMVESTTQLLVQAGIPDSSIKAERFGPTG